MTVEQINLFMAKNARLLPADQIQTLASRLIMVPDSNFNCLMMLRLRNPTIALVFSLAFGYLGFDRFYIGNTVGGILKLFTAGGFGVWTVIDWFLIMGETRRTNLRKVLNSIKF